MNIRKAVKKLEKYFGNKETISLEKFQNEEPELFEACTALGLLEVIYENPKVKMIAGE